MSQLDIIPVQASKLAFHIDLIIWTLTGLSALFTFLVVGVLAFLAYRYRKGSNVDRYLESPDHSGLELTWTILPTLMCIPVFVYAVWIFAVYSKVPTNALEINVVGKQWMWHIQHANGRREVNQLHVPTDRPVKLLMTSQDVLHSFFIPAFRTKMDVLPGRYTRQWFEATKPGVYRLFCAEYCGTEHSRMGGTVVVMPPQDYEKWLQTGNVVAAGSPEKQGEKLFTRLGCVTCHMSGVQGRAPELHGVFGTEAKLQTGESVVVDEEYIQESILIPTAKVVAGFSPLMPTYKNQVDQDDLLNLIAYIKSLGSKQQKSAAR